MFIKGCRAHLCHLPGLDQVGHPPRGTSGSAGTLNWGPMWLGPQFSLHQIFPSTCSPLMGGKRVGNWGSWWLIYSVTSGAWKILGKVPSHGWSVQHPLGLSRICLPFPFLPSSPSRCGSCPFTLYSGLISKISFCLVPFGHFVNHPPDPEIYFVNLSLAGTQQWVQRDLVSLTACPMLELHQVSLPGEGFLVAGVYLTRGLGVPRIRSHYSTVFSSCLILQLAVLIPHMYQIDYWDGKWKWEIASTQIHIFTWWVFVSWLVGELVKWAHENPASTPQGFWWKVLYIGKDYQISQYVIYLFKSL